MVKRREVSAVIRYSPVTRHLGTPQIQAVRNQALDGIRGFAILWVFAFHAVALLGATPSGTRLGWGVALAQQGMLGVQLFFVLSGFLLAVPWMSAARDGRAYPSIGRFFARRVSRILPAYWLHLALLFGLLLPLLRGGYGILGSDVGQLNLLLHPLLLHFLHPGSSSSLGLNMALWSLSIEAQFYLLLPLLAPLFVRDRVLVALPVALLISLVWKGLAADLLVDWVYLGVAPSCLVFFDPVSGQAGPFPPELMRLFLERQLPGEIAAFALGMAAANLCTRISTAAPPIWLGWVLDATAILGMVMMALILIELPLATVVSGAGWRFLGMPVFLLVCTLLVMAAALRAPLVERVLTAVPLMPIGVISYSLFLWHEPMLRLVATGWLVPEGCTGWPCRALLALALALAVATLSWLLTERASIATGRRGH